MFDLPKPPYVGVAYYPEDWPDEEMDRDIARMQEVGIKVARIGEFAWHRMEPKPGQYDFSYFHRVVDKLAAAGIAVVMGTPTATPPRWLYDLDKTVFMENKNGRQAAHGGRRHCCSNNAAYNRYSLAVVEAMAREFGDEEAIIGWQIDNEIYAWEGGCFCSNCVEKFHGYLQEKYGTVDALNEAWDLNLFSQWYDRFDQIPAPRDAWHNPHLVMEWEIFQQESHVAFVHRQAEILHRYVKVPVGTDTMPFNGIDYRRMTAPLDIVQFNHYNTPENLHACSFWFDHLRTLKEHPFWNTETATCWNGSVATSQSLKPDGYCRANSWLPIALGGEANMYWLWRTHWAGHELMHGSVIDTSGRDMITTGEVTEVARGFEAAADFVNGTKVKTPVAIHFSSLVWNMHAAQPVVDGWSYMPTVEDAIYRPAVDLGLRPDVVDAAAALDGYKLILSPMMMSLEEADLGRRMADWVKNGGVWVVGPLTDVRNAVGARYRDRFFGMLEELTGGRWDYAIPDTEHHLKAQWQDGTEFTGDTWFELWENDGDSLVTVTAGARAALGKSLVAMKTVGKGKVILLGTVPSAEDMGHILRLACGEADIALPKVKGRVMIAPRSGAAGEGMICVEYANEPAEIKLEAPMTDLITGKTKSGKVKLKPYEVLVLKA